MSDENGLLGEPLLDAGEVAELLGVPRSSVYEYARRQRNPLPSVPIGRHVRFIRSEVERWVVAQRLARAVEPGGEGRGVTFAAATEASALTGRLLLSS